MKKILEECDGFKRIKTVAEKKIPNKSLEERVADLEKRVDKIENK